MSTATPTPLSASRRWAGAAPPLAVLGSCVSLQVGAAAAAGLFPLAGSSGATLLRLALAAGVLLLVARPRVLSWTAPQRRSVLLMGVAVSGMNGFFYASLTRLDLGTAVTVEFLGPLALAAATGRHRRDLAWVALAVAGVGLLGVAGHGSDRALDPVGVLLALAAGACWAGYVLAGARVGALVPGAGGLAAATAVAAVVLLLPGLHGASAALRDPHALLLALTTALLASVVPYSLELAALRRLPTRTFGVLLSLEPAVATLAGWLLLGQRTGAGGLAGVLLVVLASAGSTATARRVEPASAAADPARARCEDA